MVSAYSSPGALAESESADGGGAARFEAPKLLDAQRIVIYGTRIPGDSTSSSKQTCSYTVTSELAPGEPAIETDVISEDPTTCTLVVVQGVPSVLPPDAESAGTATPAATKPATDEAIASYQVSAGYLHAWFQDPFGIHVNDVYSHVKWKWNLTKSYFYPDPTPSPGGPECYDNTSHAPDGWILGDHDVNCNSPGTLNYVETASYAFFWNHFFCAGTNTTTTYDRNRGRGWDDGYLRGVTQWSKSGGCTSLLAFKNVLVRTQN